MTMVMLLALSTMTLAAGQGQGNQGQGQGAKSLGKSTVDTEVGWVASGAEDGNFVVAQTQGVEIGLRAMERHEGLIEVNGINGNRVGLYQASTGHSADTPGSTNNATWNFDFHVDVSGGTNAHADRELEDYTLLLEQDYLPDEDPVELSQQEYLVCATGSLDDHVCQQSWNPGFLNADFDPEAEGTYNLRLVLTPETFNGPPLAVTIQVNVVEGE